MLCIAPKIVAEPHVSPFEQTIKSMRNKVCSWESPGTGSSTGSRAREFCGGIEGKIKSEFNLQTTTPRDDVFFTLRTSVGGHKGGSKLLITNRLLLHRPRYSICIQVNLCAS